MKNLKKRKRLTLLTGVFLLVSLVGAAFAFTPGILDISGQVGITEGDYVQFTLVEASADSAAPYRGVTSAMTNVTRNIGIPMANRSAQSIPENDAVAVSARGRTNQRVEWDVVFEQPSTARVYLEATNFSERFAADLHNVNLVMATGVPALGQTPFLPGGRGIEFDTTAPVTIDPSQFDSMFTITTGWAPVQGPGALPTPFNTSLGHSVWLPTPPAGPGSMTGFLPIPLAPNNAAGNNLDSTTHVFFVEIHWNGMMPGGGGGVTWEPEMVWVPEGPTNPGGGAWVPSGNYIRVFTEGGAGGSYSWSSEPTPGPWLANFTLELDYTIAGQGVPMP